MDTKKLRLPDGEIAYDDRGSGPPVICVPGMGDVRFQFRFLAPVLQDNGFRVVTMDLRGHGESSARWHDYSVESVGRDIIALVKELGTGPAAIIGNSMAAGAAVWAAVEEPDLISRLVLIGPAVRGTIGGAFGLFLRLLFARPWGATAWASYFSTLFPSRKPDDWVHYVRSLKKNLSEPGRLESLRRMMFVPKDAAERRLEAVAAPTLVVMGTKDPDFKQPEAEAALVADRVHGTVVLVPGAGHYPHTEMPETTNPHIAAFLRSDGNQNSSRADRAETAC